MKKALIAVAVVAVLGAVYAGVYKGAEYFLSDRFMPEVSEFVSTFYEHRDARDYDYIYLVTTDQEFRDQVDQPHFTRYMEILNSRLGKARERYRAGLQTTNTEQGRYITVSYRVRYGNVETLEGFTLKERGGRLALVDYGIYWSDKDISRDQPTPEEYEQLKDQIYDMIDKEIEQ